MEYENQMVVGATAEYERQNPDMTPEHMATLREAAADDISEKKWWIDMGLPEKIADELAYLCMAVANTKFQKRDDDAARMMHRAKCVQEAAIDWQVEND